MGVVAKGKLNCFVSAKFGPLMIFLKLWFVYDKAIEHYEKFLSLEGC